MFGIDFSRRKLLCTAAAAGSLSALGGLSLASRAIAAEAASGLTPFKVGLSALANTCLAIWIADEAGFYKAQNLDFSLQKMAGGAQSGPELKSGNIQAMHIGSSSVVRANAGGYDLRTVASLRNTLSFTLFAKAGIKTPADLKGGTIGISTFGSESDATLGMVLAKVGLSRQDVTVKELGIDPNRLAALEAGTITATMLNEPSRSHALSMGLNPIVDPLADHTPWVFTGLVVDNFYLKSHRDPVIGFLKATLEGNYLALSDAKHGKAVLAKQLNLSDPKIIDLAYDDFKKLSPVNIEVSRAGTENIIAQVAKGDASRKVDDYIDTSLMASIRSEGYIDALQKKYKLA
jgi:ABC-type nitrate/sulfonate/bicarbonate transport system substrate-binding protein